jgi:acetyl-CoA carboxylase, biotin carboxylase subunit
MPRTLRRGFMPAPGTVTSLRVPGGPGTRFDTMLYQGYQVPPFYDSLLGKLIVWDETRDAAINRMIRALDELEVGGLKTTKPLHQRWRGRDVARPISTRAGLSHGSKPTRTN